MMIYKTYLIEPYQQGSYCHTPQSRISTNVFQLPKILRMSHNFNRILLDDDRTTKNDSRERENVYK